MGARQTGDIDPRWPEVGAPTLIRRRSAAEGAGRVVDGVVRREHLVQADDAEHADDIGVHAGQRQHGPGRPGPVVGADQDADPG